MFIRFRPIVFCLVIVLMFNTIQSDDVSATASSFSETRDSCTSTDGACANTDNVDHEKEGKTKYNDPAATIPDTAIDSDVEKPDQKTYEYVSDFEWPEITRIDPGKVGDVVDVELEDGKFYKRITRATNPPIFEIPNYLSVKETRLIIAAALDQGLQTSGVIGEEIDGMFNDVNTLSDVPRVSENTWVPKEALPEAVMESLNTRLQNLIQLPAIYIESSEPMQVVSYVKKGHYHSHLDSSNSSDTAHLPCCYQAAHCDELLEDPILIEDCCRICRYMTVLFYLTDVEEGGETAFPLADTTDELLKEKLEGFENAEEEDEKDWSNLSYFCHDAPVVVKPKLGTAVMWYNHNVDETGYLGETDFRSFHGGCDVIKGNKWIANNWILATPYRDRHIMVDWPDTDVDEDDKDTGSSPPQ